MDLTGIIFPLCMLHVAQLSLNLDKQEAVYRLILSMMMFLKTGIEISKLKDHPVDIL